MKCRFFRSCGARNEPDRNASLFFVRSQSPTFETSRNTGGRLGGASTAAAFLKAFAEDTPWAHLDIAPGAHMGKDRADLARGASGFGVRTLVELVERWK